MTAGSGQALWNVVQRLDRKQFVPTIAVLKKGGELVSEIEAAGVEVVEAPICIPVKPYSTLPFRIYAAAKQFRKWNFDIWHSYHYADQYTEPLICRASGAKAYVYTKKNMSWGSRGWRVKSFFSSRIAAQNEAMMEQFFVGSSRNKVVFLPRGVCTDQFKPQLPGKVWQNVGADAMRLGCVAHIQPRKGLMALIESLVHFQNCHLYLAGKVLDQVYLDACMARAQSLQLQDRIFYLGEIQDVTGFLNGLDYFVFPSRSEGCPVALLEAMSCGVPCLAARFPGADYLIEDGVDGFLFAVDDSQGLTQALRNALATDRSQMARKSRQKMLDRFDIKLEVQRHELLYTSLLKG